MTRRERLEHRAERRHEWAASRTAKATAAAERAHNAVAGIPFGQPILVGHHSERGHRRALERCDHAMAQVVESSNMAAHHRGAAAEIERQLDRSVFSDDADAVEALEARIAAREVEAARVKTLNVAIRREQKAGLQPGWLERIGATEAERAAILRNVQHDWRHEPAFPAYVLSNLRGRITTDRERVKAIRARNARAERAEAAGGVVVEGDAWVRVTFAEKPDRSVLDALKAAGFRWGGGSWVGEREKLPTGIVRHGGSSDAPRH